MRLAQNTRASGATRVEYTHRSMTGLDAYGRSDIIQFVYVYSTDAGSLCLAKFPKQLTLISVLDFIKFSNWILCYFLPISDSLRKSFLQ